jgi:HPt (histidine-containing phosphotransfer) domain-containing protein
MLLPTLNPYMSPTRKILADLWSRNLPQVLARLDLLEAAASVMPLPPDQRAEAAATAHKLAGSLGMYGFPAGTEAARALEQELYSTCPNADTLKTLTASLRSSIG